MTDFLTQNLNVLKERFPTFSQKIFESTVSRERRVHIGPTGQAVYQVLRDGRWINLTSSYDPVREASVLTEGLNIEESKLIFVIGEGGLYHVEAALNRASLDARVIVVVQNVAEIRVVAESRDLKNMFADDRVLWLVSDDHNAIRNAISAIVSVDAYVVPTFSVVIHPIEAVVKDSYCLAVQESIRSTLLTALLDFNTTRHFESWWADNFVSNIRNYLSNKNVWELEDSWKSRPVIIVGAGPSLSKNVKLLHDFKGKALIICVDTAYRVLEKYHIVPDLIVTIDGAPANAAHLEGCNYAAIPLLMDMYSHKDIAEGNQASKVVLLSTDLHFSWWDKINPGSEQLRKSQTGGSVATAAFYFSRLIGADPVIMIGEDLSFPNGSRYADGVLRNDEENSIRSERRRLHELEDIFGNKVYTTPDYLFYLKTLEQEVKQKDRLYVNATEGGALKHGFIIQSLHSCLTEYCQEDQPVVEWKSSLSTPEAEASTFVSVLKNMKKSKRELRACVRLFGFGAAVLGRGLREISLTQSFDAVSTLTTFAERVLEKARRLELAMSFLDSCSFNALVADIRQAESLSKLASELSEDDRIAQYVQGTMNLFNSLVDRANQSVAVHERGISLLTMQLDLKKEVHAL